MSLYAPPVEKDTEIWTQLPDGYRRHGAEPDWARGNRPGQVVDCFLEGPSFDRAGNLYYLAALLPFVYYTYPYYDEMSFHIF